MSSQVLWACWLSNLASFFVLSIWVFSDGLFAETFRLFAAFVHSLIYFESSTSLSDPQLATRLLALKTLSAVAAIGGIGVLLSLFFGTKGQRGVKCWLGFTALAAVWFALGTNWSELQWQGQVYRLGRQLQPFEAVASSLQRDWPAVDGHTAELGSFSAYPIGEPETLLLVAPAKLPGASAAISTVERSDQGALRFQLTGKELGAWLEWHPSHDLPKDFVDGLSRRYELKRSTQLSNEWYLVQYK